MLHIGVDDTDALDGGCTTVLAARFLEALTEARSVGPPRLVRLNPNVPWKTRGNAAIGLRIQGALTSEAAIERLAPIVERHMRPPAPGKGPALVVTETPGPVSWYEHCVRELAHPAEARALAGRLDARVRTWGSGLGLVGALAAISWPADRSTFEIMAYRESARVGTRRAVDPASVLTMQRAFPETFDSYDEENAFPVMVPGTPCPVLFGIRATAPDRLRDALASVRSEPVAEATLFETNQATDDHLVDATCEDVAWPRSVRVVARLAERPRDLPGGHVLARLEDATGSVGAAAFEPTKGFRRVVRALAPGDLVRACGGVTRREGPPVVNLEKLEVLEAPPRARHVANPRCAACGRAMKSEGAAAGYRCRTCGARAPREAAASVTVPPGAAVGWHEVPPCARRHLARPLRVVPARHTVPPLAR